MASEMILLPVPHFQLHIRDQKSAKPLQLLHLFFSLMGLPTLVEEPPWFWPQWLSQYPLNRYTVLDYFSHSPFYDEEAKKRQINPAALADAGLGFVYNVGHSIEGNLYIIERRSLEPGSKQLGPIQAVYTFLDGIITESPSMHAIVDSRLRQAHSSLRRALSALQDVAGTSAGAQGAGNAKLGASYRRQLASLPVGQMEMEKRATSRKIVSAVVSHWLRAVPVADVGPSLPPSTEPRAARVEEGRAGPQDAERRGGGQGLENGNARGTPLVAGVKRDAPEGVVGVTPAADAGVGDAGRPDISPVTDGPPRKRIKSED